MMNFPFKIAKTFMFLLCFGIAFLLYGCSKDEKAAVTPTTKAPETKETPSTVKEEEKKDEGDKDKDAEDKEGEGEEEEDGDEDEEEIMPGDPNYYLPYAEPEDSAQEASFNQLLGATWESTVGVVLSTSADGMDLVTDLGASYTRRLVIQADGSFTYSIGVDYNDEMLTDIDIAANSVSGTLTRGSLQTQTADNTIAVRANANLFFYDPMDAPTRDLVAFHCVLELGSVMLPEGEDTISTTILVRIQDQDKIKLFLLSADNMSVRSYSFDKVQ